MFRSLSGAVLAVSLLAAGCATPSVHPIYTDDTLVTDPAVVGTWKQPGERPTYTLTRVGDGYHMVVKSDDPRDPEQWEFAVRLTQIGAHRYADVTAVEEEREAHEDHWGPLFVPTHMFCRYALERDALDVWMLSRAWLRKAAGDGTVALASTPLNKDTTLITAETLQLRAFLEKHGGDAAAFPDHTRLERVKP